MKRIQRILLPVVVLCSVLAAQEFRATISGHVFDASGAAVPNVKIQAVNVDTNETTTATTDTSGAYSIPFLRPGDYKLTAAAAGFKQFLRENITLEVGKLAGIDIHLEVGNLLESVEVTAEAALLGVPAVLISSWAGRCGNMQILEKQYGLMQVFGRSRPGVAAALALAEHRPDREAVQARRQALLADLCDMPAMVDSHIAAVRNRVVRSG